MAAACDRPECSVKMVEIACSACKKARYCSRQCQLYDWPRHMCVVGTPIGEIGESAPRLLSYVEQITRDALAYQRTHFRVRRHSQETDPLLKAGMIGRGNDSVVLAITGVEEGSKSYAMKISISDGRAGTPSVEAQTDMHVHRLFQNLFSTPTMPVPRLEGDYTVFVSLRQFFANFATPLVTVYEGSREQAHNNVLIDALSRKLDNNGSQTSENMPAYITCAIMELMTSTLYNVIRRYGPALTRDLVSNVCCNVIASLQTMRPLQATHNDLHTNNLYLSSMDSRVEYIDYQLDSDSYMSVAAMHPGYPGLLIQRARVIIADFGRSAVGRDNKDLGRWLNWPNDTHLRAQMNWPNYGNPGYDMWLLACDIIRQFAGSGTPVPAVLAHMVPSSQQITQLAAALRGYSRAAEVGNILYVVRKAVDGDPAAAIQAKSLMDSQDALRTYFWRIPWLPQYLADPMQVLSGPLRLTAATELRTTPNKNSRLIRVNQQ